MKAIKAHLLGVLSAASAAIANPKHRAVEKKVGVYVAVRVALALGASASTVSLLKGLFH